MIARSRYFVVTPPNLDNPARTGRYSPMMMRYLEGLGSGARLLGILPNREEYDRMLPASAVVCCAPDGSDLEDALDRDAADRLADDKRRAAQERVVGEHAGSAAPRRSTPASASSARVTARASPSMKVRRAAMKSSEAYALIGGRPSARPSSPSLRSSSTSSKATPTLPIPASHRAVASW